MSLAQDFEENVVEIFFKKPTETESDTGALINTYVDAFSKIGIFQMNEGQVFYNVNGRQVKTTNDVFIDKDTDTDDMYLKITQNEQRWVISKVINQEGSVDEREFEILNIEAAGEREDPYIMEVKQVKKSSS
jgi:triacylglycerol esterase/lipase EstA (alpha/beta hydrolase family)